MLNFLKALFSNNRVERALEVILPITLDVYYDPESNQLCCVEQEFKAAFMFMECYPHAIYLGEL